MAIYLVGYFLPLLMAALAIPMALGKVPPNAFYGFRTPKTLSSPTIWYPANRVGGRYMLIASLFTICFNVILLSMYPQWPSQLLCVVMAGAGAASMMVATILSMVYLRKL